REPGGTLIASNFVVLFAALSVEPAAAMPMFAPTPATAPPAARDCNATERPFSLGKMQMAAWFASIAIAYLVIWAATGTLDTLNASLLILMGIGSATAFASTFIGKQKDADAGADKGGTSPPLVKSRGFLGGSPLRKG